MKRSDIEKSIAEIQTSRAKLAAEVEGLTEKESALQIQVNTDLMRGKDNSLSELTALTARLSVLRGALAFADKRIADDQRALKELERAEKLEAARVLDSKCAAQLAELQAMIGEDGALKTLLDSAWLTSQEYATAAGGVNQEHVGRSYYYQNLIRDFSGLCLRFWNVVEQSPNIPHPARKGQAAAPDYIPGFGKVI
jgi:chromosome segregation ATPase